MSVFRPFALFTGLALALLALASPALASGAPTAKQVERVILIGVDGGDGRTVEAMMDAGELPNMARLREMGTFAPLGTALPADSPTAWASLNSGRNPAETAVPGFVRRIFSGRNPEAHFGHVDLNQKAQLEELPDRPFWTKYSADGWMWIGFGAALLGFLILFKAILGMNLVLAVAFAAVLGGVGGFALKNMRASYADTYTYLGNRMAAENFWDIAGEEGVRSIVLDAAQSFGADSPDGVHVLHGLGVPDLRGGLGDWYIYSDNPENLDKPPKRASLGTAGYEYRVDVRSGEVHSTYYGPVNFVQREKYQDELDDIKTRENDTTLGYKESRALQEELRPRKEELMALLGRSKHPDHEPDISVTTGIPKDLSVVPAGDGKYTITLGEESQTLAVGEWSDYYNLSFELSQMIKAKGTTRLKLESFEPNFRLFINTLDIAPEHQPFWQPITQPIEYGAELHRTGDFETYGWACMTMPFKEGQISPETLLEDIQFTFEWRERLFFDQIQRDDWQLFMGLFSATDRVQHMFYQYYDEGHPLYDAEVANRTTTFFGEEIALKDAIPAIFKQVDRVVGRVLDEHLQDGDLLMMCADHGFQSFRHQVNVNNLLAEAGLLTLKPGVPTSAGGKLGDYVDWANTKAYALGLGGVYVNLRGREPNGIVAPEDKDAVVEEIRRALLDYRDPRTGEAVASHAYVTAELHQGDHLDGEPDVMTGFAPTYRVSWGTTGGGALLRSVDNPQAGVDGAPEKITVMGPAVVDNDSPWSGGHPSVAGEHVKGLFFSSQPMALPAGGPDLLHIAPTVLSLLGVAVPPEMDLAPLELK